ncbi:hypothetical protein ADUPG1_011926 [Aduncisulcus paluster]|uniref:C2HC/C3H-type domain-containing protein n=1 Tax=Aduncisulcus paluster TaxID=2918883 RepID=A0ABQ5JXQ0_9EUKA|nr:hypothetical protein ADUPG1_011926 [Aduncisulcus paluster]
MISIDNGLICQSCGGKFFIHGIRPHEKQCALKQDRYRKAINEHRLPGLKVAPHFKGEPIPVKIRHEEDWDAIDAYNAKAITIYNRVSKAPCPGCHRSFPMFSLLDHAKECPDYARRLDAPKSARPRRRHVRPPPSSTGGQGGYGGPSAHSTPSAGGYGSPSRGSVPSSGAMGGSGRSPGHGGMSPSNPQAFSLPPPSIPATEDADGRVECRYCHRKFNADRISKHESICVKTKSRTIKGHKSEARKKLEMGLAPSASVASDGTFIRGGKNAGPASHPKPKASSGPRKSIAERMADSRVACKFCGRKFSDDRITKHEEICSRIESRTMAPGFVPERQKPKKLKPCVLSPKNRKPRTPNPNGATRVRQSTSMGSSSSTPQGHSPVPSGGMSFCPSCGSKKVKTQFVGPSHLLGPAILDEIIARSCDSSKEIRSKLYYDFKEKILECFTHIHTNSRHMRQDAPRIECCCKFISNCVKNTKDEVSTPELISDIFLTFIPILISVEDYFGDFITKLIFFICENHVNSITLNPSLTDSQRIEMKYDVLISIQSSLSKTLENFAKSRYKKKSLNFLESLVLNVMYNIGYFAPSKTRLLILKIIQPHFLKNIKFCDEPPFIGIWMGILEMLTSSSLDGICTDIYRTKLLWEGNSELIKDFIKSISKYFKRKSFVVDEIYLIFGVIANICSCDVHYSFILYPLLEEYLDHWFKMVKEIEDEVWELDLPPEGKEEERKEEEEEEEKEKEEDIPDKEEDNVVEYCPIQEKTITSYQSNMLLFSRQLGKLVSMLSRSQPNHLKLHPKVKKKMKWLMKKDVGFPLWQSIYRSYFENIRCKSSFVSSYDLESLISRCNGVDFEDLKALFKETHSDVLNLFKISKEEKAILKDEGRLALCCSYFRSFVSSCCNSSSSISSKAPISTAQLFDIMKHAIKHIVRVEFMLEDVVTEDLLFICVVFFKYHSLSASMAWKRVKKTIAKVLERGIQHKLNSCVVRLCLSLIELFCRHLTLSEERDELYSIVRPYVLLWLKRFNKKEFILRWFSILSYFSINHENSPHLPHCKELYHLVFPFISNLLHTSIKPCDIFQSLIEFDGIETSIYGHRIFYFLSSLIKSDETRAHEIYSIISDLLLPWHCTIGALKTKEDVGKEEEKRAEQIIVFLRAWGCLISSFSHYIELIPHMYQYYDHMKKIDQQSSSSSLYIKQFIQNIKKFEQEKEKEKEMADKESKKELESSQNNWTEADEERLSQRVKEAEDRIRREYETKFQDLEQKFESLLSKGMEQSKSFEKEIKHHIDERDASFKKRLSSFDDELLNINKIVQAQKDATPCSQTQSISQLSLTATDSNDPSTFASAFTDPTQNVLPRSSTQLSKHPSSFPHSLRPPVSKFRLPDCDQGTMNGHLSSHDPASHARRISTSHIVQAQKDATPCSQTQSISQLSLTATDSNDPSTFASAFTDPTQNVLPRSSTQLSKHPSSFPHSLRPPVSKFRLPDCDQGTMNGHLSSHDPASHARRISTSHVHFDDRMASVEERESGHIVPTIVVEVSETSHEEDMSLLRSPFLSSISQSISSQSFIASSPSFSSSTSSSQSMSNKQDHSIALEREKRKESECVSEQSLSRESQSILYGRRRFFQEPFSHSDSHVSSSHFPTQGAHQSSIRCANPSDTSLMVPYQSHAKLHSPSFSSDRAKLPSTRILRDFESDVAAKTSIVSADMPHFSSMKEEEKEDRSGIRRLHFSSLSDHSPVSRSGSQISESDYVHDLFEPTISLFTHGSINANQLRQIVFAWSLEQQKKFHMFLVSTLGYPALKRLFPKNS